MEILYYYLVYIYYIFTLCNLYYSLNIINNTYLVSKFAKLFKVS